MCAVAARLPFTSITSEAERRLQGFQVPEIVLADGLQFFGDRGSLETIGQVIEPALILDLQVDERLNGITPTLRAATAVLWTPVENALSTIFYYAQLRNRLRFLVQTACAAYILLPQTAVELFSIVLARRSPGVT